MESPTAAPRGRPSLLLAAQLGAEIETRSGDLVSTTLEVASARNVTQIVVGRPAVARRWRPFRPALGTALLRAAPSYALHIVPAGAPVRARPAAVPDRQDWRAWAGATALVAAVTGAGLLAGALMPQEAMGMVFLAAVVVAASLQGVRLALYTAIIAFLAWDFFFIPPVGTISIANTHDAVALAVFLAVAAITGGLASRVRAEARAGQARIASLRRISLFSRRLGQPATKPELLAEIVRQAADAGGNAAAAMLVSKDGDLHQAAAHPPTATLDEGSWAAARWAAAHTVETGAGTTTLPAAPWRFLPVRTARGTAGILGLRTSALLDGPALQAIEALVDQAALALERLRLSDEAARTAAMEDTQKLRTALLNSLSHDLRTPLTGIRGAAGTLREAWDDLPPATRADLLASIEEDTARMTRFLANIMDLTRLESGQVSPRLEPVDTAEIVEAAIARVPGAAHFAVSAPTPPPHALADPALLEQVLVNLLENAVKYAPRRLPRRRPRGRGRPGGPHCHSRRGRGHRIRRPAARLRQLPACHPRRRRGAGHRPGPRHRPRPGGSHGRPHRRCLAPPRRATRRFPRHRRHPPLAGRMTTPIARIPRHRRRAADPPLSRSRPHRCRLWGRARRHRCRGPAPARFPFPRPRPARPRPSRPRRPGTPCGSSANSPPRPSSCCPPRDRDAEKIDALDNGADDFVEKPFSVGELLARIRTALRHARVRDAVPDVVRVGALSIDMAQHQVRLAGELLPLSPREFDLLHLLATNARRVMTHRQLLTAVWGPAHADDVQYLRVYIGHLRSKLGEGVILTEPRIGYRLAAPDAAAN